MKIKQLALDEIKRLGQQAYTQHQNIMREYPKLEPSDRNTQSARLMSSLEKQCEWIVALKEIAD